MHALKIGWKTFFFPSAKDAAAVMDALAKAESVDSLYNGPDHKVMWYKSDTNIQLETLGAVEVYPDHDTLKAFINERLEWLAKREAAQAEIDRLTAPKPEAPADAFDGS